MSVFDDRVDVRIEGPDIDRAPVSATLRLEGAVKEASDTCRARMVVLAVVFCAGFLLVGGRLFEVMAMQDGTRSLVQSTTTVPLGRADIVDRNGLLLATNLPTASLYAEPRRIIDPVDAADRLRTVLPGLSRDDLILRFSTERGFVWVQRNLTPRQQADIHALGIPGVGFMREERRVYPQGSLTAHVVGFTDIDRRGLAGIEAYFDNELQVRSAADEDAPLELSIDLRFQQVVREEVQATIDRFSALGGTGIVLDVTTGEVVAMVSLPDFDANRPTATDPEARFNRATLGVYEIGSIFKVFTAAMALDAGVVNMASGYDASSPIRIARFTIRDYKPKNRWLSLPEILVYSSNIGAAKMAVEVGAEGQREFLGRIGLLSPSQVEVPERGSPMIPGQWREINTMTIGFGHGLAVTPVQAAAAFAAMVNGGILYQPTLLRWNADQPPPGVQVLDPEISNTMRLLTHLVVLYGSGRNARVPGYLIGGKTGTAEKLDSRGGYAEDRLLSSFMGAFPIDNPRYVVLVMIDEPHGIPETYGYATAGWTAAPAAGRIISRIGPLAGIPPRDSRLAELPPVNGNDSEQLEAILAAFAAR